MRNPSHETQLAFWRALCAPFAEHELSTVKGRGGMKELTYIDKRSLENRLDDVAGPFGWFPEFEATARGYKCRLSILCPTGRGDGDGWEWIAKEDGAGTEEMGSNNRQTGEWEPDVDNDEKSGYTNALRRSAQDAWGIGRYLYKKGVAIGLMQGPQEEALARWVAMRLGDGVHLDQPGVTPMPPKAAPNGKATAGPATQHPSAPPAELAEPEPAPARPPARAASSNGRAPDGGFDNFQLPTTTGKAVFAWSKRMEEHYEVNLINGMKNFAADRGWGTNFLDWTLDQAQAVARSAIHHIKGLPNYKGEFAHVETAPPEPAPAPLASPAPTPEPEMAPLRADLMAHVRALHEVQTGAKPTPGDEVRLLKAISVEAANGAGHKGEVIESLKKCTDAAWIKNMIAYAQEQIPLAKAAKAEAPVDGDDDIPF